MRHVPHLAAQRGVTLVETGVVVAIAAIAAALGTPSLKTLVDNRRLDGAAALLAADVQFARVQAIARNEPVRMALDAGASCWVIHTGAAGDCSCHIAGTPSCAPGASPLKTVALRAADGVALTANVGAILFDPVHGTSTPTGTLRVVDANGREIRHVVNVMGRTRSCAAGGAVPGYRAC
jgi:type IV fimbrial biogenesis protein FimT